LSGSSAFTLMAPTSVVAALGRMQKPTEAGLDFGTARELASREGLKAIVDGKVTGAAGGYIVAIRLVRADSGIELASFHESADGLQGLIKAADKLARRLRSKAGESLREVNATPPLARATTSSLEALRKYSEATRANSLGDRRAVLMVREAIAIDSTFASGWSALAANLSNYGGTQSAIDSALTNAYRYRDRLPALERGTVTARYFAMGPGRDRAKAIAAYEEILRRGDTTSGVLVNLGEQLRSRREFARAESLNVAALRLVPANGTALGNASELQLNQGKFEEAAATIARLKQVSIGYGVSRELFLVAVQGDDKRLRAMTDSLMRAGGEARERTGLPSARSLAIRDGRLREYRLMAKEAAGSGTSMPDDEIFEIAMDIALKGPSAVEVMRLDSAIARIPFRDLPMVDRPYLQSAALLARAGQADKARAMVARYRSEMTDTSLRRVQQSDLHYAVGQIALAAGKPHDALVEFRLADVGYDGAPVNECASCLPFELARAFDAAGMTDSAIVMFERYLATPFWLKPTGDQDPLRLPAIRERLGQLYESTGNVEKAIENHRRFIDLWKAADPELQPRVAAARQRLARLTVPEKPRH
jgi:tetratricopeptide (TPR) repeat protein